MQKIKTIFIIILFILPTTSFSESSVFALTKKSLGEHHYPYSAAALGRGGFAMAFPDSVQINQVNFSLWSFMPRTTFTLEMMYQGLGTESKTDQISSYDGTFLGGYLTIPLIQHKMAIGFGIQPSSFNNQGFLIQNLGVGAPAEQTIKTKGTLSEVQVAATYAPNERMSFGVLMYYILGKITDNTTITYADRDYASIIIENQYQFYGLAPSFGVSGFYRMFDWLSLGGRLKIPTKVKVFSKQKSLTTNKTIDRDQKVSFPVNITVGFSIQPFERLILGGDIDYIDWKNGYLFNGLPISQMNNNFRIGAGFEYLPSKRRLTSYGDKMNYRAGAFFGQMNFLANDETINEYGISLGLGLPIRSGNSRVDVAFQLGQRGDLGTNNLSEKFFRLNLQVSANELWFVRDDR
ncbi:MAG: hypothetical protein E4H13_09195 [Calditrichales bacterium]|nr:MAG: hypothetical protein E4H13_09195 [Calditrichales bacterium]